MQNTGEEVIFDNHSDYGKLDSRGATNDKFDFPKRERDFCRMPRKPWIQQHSKPKFCQKFGIFNKTQESSCL